jgi:Bacterial Ig-like domain
MNSMLIKLSTVLILVLTACPTDTKPTPPASPPPPPAPAAPTVVSVIPANSATGVSADAQIVVTFSKPMDQAVTQVAYQSADLPAVGVTFDWNAAGTEMTIKPNAPLEYTKGTNTGVVAKNYEFKLTSTAKDKSGLTLVPLTSSFKTLRDITATLSSDPNLDGYVQSDGFADSSDTALYVGDKADNVGLRGFLSFDLSALPAGVDSGLLSAILKVGKYKDSTFPNATSGSPFSLATNPARLDQMDLDHVAYGSSLDSGDYNTNSIALIGAIDSFDLRGIPVTQADALSAVRDDLTHSAARGNRSQYRLSLFKPTNSDGVADFIIYGSASVAPKPSLILEYLIP